jgi:lysophospholipase L1-like esterase
MDKKKILAWKSLYLRMLFALFSLPLIAAISATDVSAATYSTQPQQYLALGDSLAFGYQPNQDFTHGYAIDLFQTLQAKQNFNNLVNLGCPGETSSTFIKGNPNCPTPQVAASSQLSVAIAYLQQNASTTGLITLQIGANDVLSAINPATCATQVDLFNTNLATLDHNLTSTILPQLHAALKSSGGQHTRLALVKYYNPFQPFCPNTTPYVQELNQHLQADAEGYAQTVSIYKAFDSSNTLVCQLTWICSTYQDIHPTDQGYQIIAGRIYHEVYIEHDK